MKLLLQTAGFLQLILAGAHAVFPRRFHWKEETARLSRLNQQIFYVHTFFVGLILVLFGLLSVFLPHELLRPDTLPRVICGGISFFWLCRLLAQWFVYDSSLWKGLRFETTVHFLFTILWLCLTIVYGLPALGMDPGF